MPTLPAPNPVENKVVHIAPIQRTYRQPDAADPGTSVRPESATQLDGAQWNTWMAAMQVPLVESRNNVIMTRTFSKIYGLGDVIGSGYGSQEIITVAFADVQSVRLALAAAEAAMRDVAHTESAAQTMPNNDYLRSRTGVSSVFTSTANLSSCGLHLRIEAIACNDYLATQGFGVCGGYGLTPTDHRLRWASCRRVVQPLGNAQRM
jgi:histidinol-phosphate/aromatic aminotransferase/cobyric acid decarboxylase-like protein